MIMRLYFMGCNVCLPERVFVRVKKVSVRVSNSVSLLSSHDVLNGNR